MAAKNIKRVPFPDWLATTDCKISSNTNLSEDGENVSSFEYKGKCIYSVKNRAVTTKDGKTVTVIGKLIFEGDIAPKIKDDALSSGKAEFRNHEYTIHSVSRPQNPDGTVHHTTFEVY